MSGFPVLRIRRTKRVLRIRGAGLFPMFYLLLALLSTDAFGMGAICISDSTDIYVTENLTASIEIHKSFEITSESGIRFAQVVIPINDFIDVQNIKGYTELPGGNPIKLSKKNISISSVPVAKGLGGYQAVTVSLRTPTVGSRVYYEYKLVIKSLLYLPRITRRTDCPTKKLIVNLKWDKKINLRYDADGVDIFPEERQARFVANDLPEIPNEPESCPDKLQISISADIFNYDKNQYYSRTWPEVGRFFALLAVQPSEAENELKSLIRSLCVNSLSREDTLSAFFNFLADSVSYVALQMGKGDFTPHTCSDILSRRFGDCKDQSILLTSLCRVAGIDAYPALVYTGSYPAVEKLHPWPAWFDHVVTVVRQPDSDLILDPSDPVASAGSIPPRLRGKSYLVCDGHSELKTAPPGPDPAFGISWNFNLHDPVDNKIDVEFSLNYYGDAAATYRDFWRGKTRDNAGSVLQEQLRNSGWDLSNPQLAEINNRPETLVVSGHFTIDITAVGDSHNLSIASPLNAYLLNNVFSDARKNDYCHNGSIQLDETITIALPASGLNAGPEYSDSWGRQGLTFSDELSINKNKAVYHRVLYFANEIFNATDYNAFRDFLLSRRDQQYVRLQK